MNQKVTDALAAASKQILAASIEAATVDGTSVAQIVAITKARQAIAEAAALYADPTPAAAAKK
jgi:hypothetical protein